MTDQNENENEESMSSRNETPNELVLVGTEAPGFLAQYMEDDTSLASLAEYKTVPWVKIVQGTTPAAVALKEEFGDGAAIITPGNELIAKKGDSFDVVPIFQFTEFCHWSDLDDKKSDMILGKTVDPEHEIAKNARHKDKRKYQVPDTEFEERFVEHLNFLCIIYTKDHPMRGRLICISYEKGEFNQGRVFCTSLMQRKGPLWSQVWSLKVGTHKNQKYTWYGFDHSSPKEPFILESEVAGFKAAYDDAVEGFKKEKLGVDRSAGDEDNAEGAIDVSVGKEDPF